MFSILNTYFNKEKKREKEETEEERLYYKEIYDYTSQKLDSLYERKRHIETKSLYILQASAIVITLFTALLGYLIKFTGTLLNISMGIIFIFYIIMGFCIISLLLSLNDSILKSKIIRSKVEKIDDQAKYIDVSKLKENEKIANIETPHPKEFPDYNQEGYNIQKYYRKMVISLSKSIYSLNRINIAKSLLLNSGLFLFVISIILVISLGILVA